MSIDLHIHSNFSDGVFSPQQLVEIIYKKGLRAFSLTDHDTTLGLKQAKIHSRSMGIEFIPGVEISAKWDKGMLHVLGYFIDPENPALQQGLENLRAARKNRNPKIIKKLNELGMDITMEEVLEESKHGVMGRPNIARVLVRKKYAKNFKHAFELFLDNGKPGFVEKEKMPPDVACGIISSSGGIPVIAHPVTLGVNQRDLFDTLKWLKHIGFKGVEAIYPEHSKTKTAFLIESARKLGMFITGGSDFHDNTNEKVFPGCVNVDYKYLAQIKDYLKVN